MLKFGNKEFRGLEEQVQKNKEDIEDIKELNIFINGLGIKVLGTLESQEEIPEQEYEYGDAYLIGYEEPYDLYVYTRKEIGAEWVNLGKLAIAGPKGDRGEPGTASKWYTGNGTPIADDSIYNVNDMYLDNSTATVYTYEYRGGSNKWITKANIRGSQGVRGEQGIQGPVGPKGDRGEQGPIGERGERGDVGGFIQIAGVVASSQQLPDPMVLRDLTKAYLVGPNPQAYSLYVQIGSDSTTAYWQNMGPLNVATYVSVNGVYQGIWDSDTKLDKKENTSYQYSQVYAVGRAPTSTAEIIPATDSAVSNSIVRRDSSGNFNVNTPTENNNPATKKYVDDLIAGASGGGGKPKAYLHSIYDDDDGHTYILSWDETPYTRGQVVRRELAKHANEIFGVTFGDSRGTDLNILFYNRWMPVLKAYDATYGNALFYFNTSASSWNSWKIQVGTTDNILIDSVTEYIW